MKVLITGGAGFIGSHLAESMLNDFHEVTIIDDLSTGCLYNIKDIMHKDKFKFVHENVSNMNIMNSLVENCEIVIHLAAAVGVNLVVEKPIHTIETNIHGSEVVLSLSDKFGRKVFMASTSEIYGKNINVPFKEYDDSILGATIYNRWGYACSKMIDEFLSLAYHKKNGLEVIIGRFFNIIGPRQSGTYGMVVPRFVRSALKGEPLMVYGDGQQQRCFCHVFDVVNAIKKLIVCHDAVGEVINIGTDRSITIQQLAEMIVFMCKSDSEIRKISYEEVYGKSFEDMVVRRPNLEKVRGLIEYKLDYSLEQTLLDVILYEKSKMLRKEYDG